MISFERIVRLSLTSSFILLIGSIVAWYFIPAWHTVIAGYALGTAFSILNGVITAIKTAQTSEFALKQRKKRPGTGALQRFLLAGFAGFAAVRFPAYFHYAGVIVGLTTVTVLSLIIAMADRLKKDETTTERGEK